MPRPPRDATELKAQLRPAAGVGVGEAPAGPDPHRDPGRAGHPLTDDDGNQVTDYPSIVDLKATAGGIRPGEFGEFQLSVGPLPKAESMTSVSG